MTGQDVVREAEAWLGTPFHPQASLKGVGCDCKGLVWGVAREVGLPEGDSLHARIADYDEVDEALLFAGMKATFIRVRELAAGRVALIRMGPKVQHLGIVTPDDLIHATGRGVKQVVKTPLTKAWRSRITSIWAWPSLEG